MIQPSPLWMQMRLIKSGIRPINNVVDISNYVLLEFGQPIHMFDYDKIGSTEIVTRYAKDGETMTTLDGKERELLAVSYTHLTLPTTRLVCRSRWSPYH